MDRWAIAYTRYSIYVVTRKKSIWVGPNCYFLFSRPKFTQRFFAECGRNYGRSCLSDFVYLD